MLSRNNSMGWIGRSEVENQPTAASWPQNTTTTTTTATATTNGGGGFDDHSKQETEMGSLYTFNSMLQTDHQDPTTTTAAAAAMHEISFSPNFNLESAADNDHLLFHPVDYSSATCSPTSASVFNAVNHHHAVNYFLPPKPLTHQTAPAAKNPFDSAFESGCENGYLESAFIKAAGFGSESPQMGSINNFNGGGFLGNTSNYDSLFLNTTNNRIKVVNPLDNLAQPTLFQKRAALRKNVLGNSNLGCLNLGGVGGGNSKSPSTTTISGVNYNVNKRRLGDDLEDVSTNNNDLCYDSDDDYDDDQVLGNSNNNIGVSYNDLEEISGKNGGSSSNGNSTVAAGGGGPDRKGKKKGPPAKNLMAERRRRKKLNDRLLMLRSVVPNISKMDRTSILGDAIDYLKELLQKINDLNNELESTPPTPTAPVFPSRFKEEQRTQIAFPTPLSSPTGGQPSRVEVRLREGRGLSIHMLSGCKPGLLLSTMRAMDNLGLDVQQAVISCFNGFALDVFRAEQCLEGQDLHPEQIKAMLMDSASFHHGML
ncbi:hypothetical protein ACP275_04G119400 [Erythranthe tilingii]